MANNPEYNNIFQQLERMTSKMDEISKEVQLTNIEIAKLAGMKHTLQDLKDWKINVEGAVNAEDLRLMKTALADVKKHAEEIEFFEKELESLKRDKEKDKEEIEKLNTFKTKTVTLGTIMVFAFSAALTILGWFIS